MTVNRTASRDAAALTSDISWLNVVATAKKTAPSNDNLTSSSSSMVMSPLLKPTWTRVFLPLLSLGFPLGVLLMILLRLPVEELEIASTDTRLLRGFSTFWCGWQEVTSTHPFYAYKVPDTPRVVLQERDLNMNILAFRFTLSKGHYHYLRYHMLEGSTIEASGCAGDHPVQLDIVYGEDQFNSCSSLNGSPSPRLNMEHSASSHSFLLKNKGSREDKNRVDYHQVLRENRKTHDDSSEEDDDDSSSSEESNFRPNVNNILSRHKRVPTSSTPSTTCPGSLFQSEIGVVSEKSDQNYPTCPSKFTNPVRVTRPGSYYVMTRGDSFNHVLLHVRLNRSSYELPENMILCRSQNSCEIPLNFGSNEKVVVFVAAEPDAGSVLFPIRSKCKPRLVFYVCVFLVFPILFAVALTLAIRQARRAKGQISTSGNCRRLTVGTGCSAPLLEAVVTEDGLVKSEIWRLTPAETNDPPPYPLVTGDQLPPPSYQRALMMARNLEPSLHDVAGHRAPLLNQSQSEERRENISSAS